MQSPEADSFIKEYPVGLALKAWGLGYWEWDIQKNLVKQRIGIDQEEFSGTCEEWLEKIFTEDINELKILLAQSLQNKEEFSMEFRMHFQNQLIRLKTEVQVVRDSKEAAIRLIGASRDITKEYFDWAQQQMQLKICKEELEALIYTIAHDIRAPLRGVDGWSLALLEDCSHLLNEKGQGYLSRVRFEARQMSELIEDLLSVLQVIKTEIRYEIVNLSNLAQKIVDNFKNENVSRNINITIDPELYANCDPRLMEMVIANLLGNAFKFTAKTKETLIEFGVKIVNGEKVFFCRDNGVGFNNLSEKKLFGVFQRMHKAAEFPGHGIGLAMAKKIINLHQGRIWAESTVNNGASFYFTITDRR